MPSGTRRHQPRDLQMWIDGNWVPALSGRTFTDHSPWDGTAVAVVPAGDAEDAEAAVLAAAAAFPGWAGYLPADRQRIFLRAADIVEERSSEIHRLLAEETGCGLQFARIQTDFAQTLLRQAAYQGYKPLGELLASDVSGQHAFTRRRPVGVVAAIPPWNAAVTLSFRAVTAALAAGNSVVLKPSEEAPWTGGTLIAEVFHAAGLPAGVLNVVTHAPGEAGSIADALVTSPHVRKLNFTGSTPTGRRLSEAAGRNLKPVLLQLSGSNPLIILPGADIAASARSAAFGSFVHQGQVCMCSRRILVHDEVADEFTSRFVKEAQALAVGDPRDPGVVIGPLINEWAVANVDRRVHEAVTRGAMLLAGGESRGNCYLPTVLTDVPDDCEISEVETFGPVALIERVEDTAAAIARANAAPYALSAGVFAPEGVGHRVAHALTAGMVHVNDQPVNDQPHMPFGGSFDSGWGRFGMGPSSDDFTEVQLITGRAAPRDPLS